MPRLSVVQSREREGVALCLVAAAGFAGLLVMGKLAYAAGVNVITLLAMRFAIAAPVLWILVARRGGSGFGGIATRAAGTALAVGMILYSAEAGLAFAALERLDASLTELLLYCYPALVVIAAFVLGIEPVARRTLGALLIATGGVVLVLAGSATAALDPLGAALGLGAAALYAAYTLSVGAIVRHVQPMMVAALICTGAAITFGTIGVASGTLQLALGADAWGWCVAIALISTVVAMSAAVGGVARLGVARASILATLEPPCACLLAFLAFDERLTPLQLLGGVLVVLAALVLQVRQREAARAAPAHAARA